MADSDIKHGETKKEVLRNISSVDLEKFINDVTPDWKCSVCGHDEFGVTVKDDHVAVVSIPTAPTHTSPIGHGLSCFCYFCNRCGAVNLVAAHIALEHLDV